MSACRKAGTRSQECILHSAGPDVIKITAADFEKDRSWEGTPSVVPPGPPNSRALAATSRAKLGGSELTSSFLVLKLRFHAGALKKLCL